MFESHLLNWFLPLKLDQRNAAFGLVVDALVDRIAVGVFQLDSAFESVVHNADTNIDEFRIILENPFSF